MGLDDTDWIRRLARALEILRERTGRELEIQTVLALTTIASEGEVRMADLQEQLGLSSAAMSRNVSMLSDVGYGVRDGERLREGMNLIVVRVDPMDRRQRHLSLSPQGVALMRRVAKVLAPQTQKETA